MWVGSALSFWADMPEAGWACIVVIVVNAIFSFWQEFKSRKGNQRIEGIDSFLREGNKRGQGNEIPTGDIVPGDIIVIEEGDSIPADARLIESQELRVTIAHFRGDPNSHTKGRGLPDGKDFLWLEIPNLIFAGTSVAAGMGKAVVIATGMSTEIGKITYLTQTVKEESSPLQKEVNRLSKLIAVIAVVMVSYSSLWVWSLQK